MNLPILRDARWMTRDRARAYLLAYAALCLPILVEAGLRLLGWREPPPADTDFLSFHAAARLALDGNPAGPWLRDVHAAMQTAIQGREGGRYFAFFYPPVFLLICLPFGLLPVLPAYLAWMAATGAACLAALRAWTAERGWAFAILVLLAPASLLNILHGQNAFLSTALLAAAGALLDRRPALAGLAFATLAFKPQLGILVVPVLLAGRRWTAIGAACAGGFAWGLAAWAAFGTEAWRAFLARMPEAGEVLASGALATWKVLSLYASARSLGAPEAVATLVQAAATLATVAAVVRAVWRGTDGRATVALVAAGAPLVTPFVLVYDFVVLLVPTLWIATQARRDGFRPWEKSLLLLTWLMPAMAFLGGLATGVSPGPIPAAIMLALVLRRLSPARATT